MEETQNESDPPCEANGTNIPERQVVPDFGELTYDTEATANFRKTCISEATRFSIWQTHESRPVLRKDMTPLIRPQASHEELESYRGEEMAAEMVRALGGRAPLTRVEIDESRPAVAVWCEYLEGGSDMGFGAAPKIAQKTSPVEFARTHTLKGLLGLRGDAGQLLLVDDRLYLYDSLITPEILATLTTNPEAFLKEYVYGTASVLSGPGLMIDHFLQGLSGENWKLIESYLDDLATKIDGEEINATLGKYGSSPEEIIRFKSCLHRRLEALRQITDFLAHYNEQNAELRAAFIATVITATGVRILNPKTGVVQDLTPWADVENSREAIRETFQRWQLRQ